MSLSKSLSRSLSRSLSTGLTGDGLDPDFLAYRTLASSLVSEPFDLTATNPAYTTSVVEAIQNARFVGYKGTVPSRWSNAGVYGTPPTPVDVWNNNLTEVYGLSMVKFAGLRAKLKYDSVSTLTNNNFVAGDYDPLSGLTGDGSSKYLGTGFNYSALTPYNISMHMHLTAATSKTTVFMGAFDGTNYVDMYRVSPGDMSVRFTQPVGNVISTNSTGIFTATADASNNIDTYKNGSAGTTTNGTGNTSAAIDREVYLYVNNSNGSPGTSYGNHTAATKAFGLPFTAAASEWFAWVESCVAVDGGYNTFDPTVRWP